MQVNSPECCIGNVIKRGEWRSSTEQRVLRLETRMGTRGEIGNSSTALVAIGDSQTTLWAAVKCPLRICVVLFLGTNKGSPFAGQNYNIALGQQSI